MKMSKDGKKCFSGCNLRSFDNYSPDLRCSRSGRRKGVVFAPKFHKKSTKMLGTIVECHATGNYKFPNLQVCEEENRFQQCTV